MDSYPLRLAELNDFEDHNSEFNTCLNVRKKLASYALEKENDYRH